MFTLHCTTTDGESVKLRYSPHSSELTNIDGSPVLTNTQLQKPRSWADATSISPNSPGLKQRNPQVLKIQLGLGCNYACSYCSQANHVSDMAISKTADALSFLADLDRWMEGIPTEIEFWGGEPLLYFRKLEILVPELDRRFPDAEFSMVTNGSLLTPEILAFIELYDIRITVSHDGPAQHLRGEDPFDDPFRGPLISALWRERKTNDRMIFSSVLTPINSDPVSLRAWFVEKLDDPDVVTSLEGIVAVHDDKTLKGSGTWTGQQYKELRENIAQSFETHEALKIPALLSKAEGFLQAIVLSAPSSASGQKCGMDRSDHLAVDLHSNVLTCQNTGANGHHGLGNALEMEEVFLNTSTHWSHRECCTHCPVLQLCGGSCMYLDGEEFAQSCENEYQFGLGLLDGILRRTFGLKLKSIEGDVRRPVRRKTISITLAQ